MKNKQKAWRLGAMLLGPHKGRANKAWCTGLGVAFRDDLGLQRRLQQKMGDFRGRPQVVA